MIRQTSRLMRLVIRCLGNSFYDTGSRLGNEYNRRDTLLRDGLCTMKVVRQLEWYFFPRGNSPNPGLFKIFIKSRYLCSKLYL